MLVSEVKRLDRGPWWARGPAAGGRGQREPGRPPLTTQLLSRPWEEAPAALRGMLGR